MKRINLALILLLITAGLLTGSATAQEDSDGELPWWNDRIFYEIFVRSFYDSNGDGTGDLQGVIEKLDYLNDGDPETTDDLGITGIWLMPVMESPSYHGYDVIDYTKIEKDYGTRDDFQALIKAAHERDIVVITDLVINHTSNQHPWFFASKSPGGRYDDWYIWTNDSSVAGERGPWNQPIWHPADGRYYYGIFWSGMPDLNYETPEVTEQMYEIARFWLEEMDVDGFRLDAVKYLYENEFGLENLPVTREWLQEFNDYIKSVEPGALAVGEIWDASEIASEYVREGSVDLAFEFDLAQTMLRSSWVGSSQTMSEVQTRVTELYPTNQYAAFLSNHDQKRVMNAVLDDMGAAKVAASLLLTNPGVPFIYYGEEVGMHGDKPDERIRTPMPWDAGTGVGFTTAQPWETPAAGFETFNVAAQTGDPDSLLSHYRNLIHLRNAHQALRIGAYRRVESETRGVYSFLRYTEDETLLVIINMKSRDIDDYTLALVEGPLESVTSAAVVFGEDAEPAVPVVNAAGSFESYTPLPALPPYSTTVIHLVP